MITTTLLVQIIDGEELFVKKSKAFKDVNKAEEYFKNILINDFKVEDKEDIAECLDDGYYADDTHFSVVILEIPIEI